MPDRVLQQRLQQEARHHAARRQVTDVPAHLQPVTQAQLLDSLVGARDLDFFLECDLRARVAQADAEQVGEVLDRFLGLRRIRARQRGDRVHAVKQEMRPDPRLQRADARAGLEFDRAAPLLRNVEITQRERPDYGGNQHVGQHEGPVRIRENGRRCAELRSPQPTEQMDRFGQQAHRAHHQRQRPCDAGAQRLAGQPRSRSTQHRGTQQPGPEQESRGAREVEPERGVTRLAREREYEAEQRRDQHDAEHGARFTEIGQE